MAANCERRLPQHPSQKCPKLTLMIFYMKRGDNKVDYHCLNSFLKFLSCKVDRLIPLLC